MIPFVTPGTNQSLHADGGCLVSEDGDRFPIVNGIPRFVSSEGYAAAFGLQWRVYARTQLDSRTGRSISKERLERCLGTPLESLKDLDVLEAGCGAGRFTELLVHAGAHVHAVDLSQAVDANRENVGSHSNYTVAQADILNLPFPANSFDIVVCLGVLQHLPSPEVGIEALWSRVKPGGRLVIDHYRWDMRSALGESTRLSTLYRAALRRLPPRRAMKITDAMSRAFFPLHWAFRKSRCAQFALSRVSGCSFHYYTFPELSKEQLQEWSRLDTFDSLTDRYKHRRSVSQIRASLSALGASEVWVAKGGNGVEARARKALPV